MACRLKPRKFVVAPDVHGIEKDRESCEAIISFCREFRPDVAVLNGDLFDFAALRRGASADEQSQALDGDYEAGIDFAELFLRYSPERHFLLGNHDKRIYDLLGSADGRLKSLGRSCVEKLETWCRGQRVQTYPYDSRLGVLELGHLNVVHGFFAGQNACAQHSRVYSNVLFGHVHSIEAYQTPGLQQKEARAIGCLCKLDLHYVNHSTAKLRWSNGFAYGFLHADGTYSVFQARKINGSFHVATDFKTF